MSKFPLYDSLTKDIPTNDLTLANKRLFLKRIEKIDQQAHELVYALIRTYQIDKNDDKNINFTLPYEGSYVESDIHFDLDKLPIHLKNILFKFLSVHVDKMKEDEKIESQTPVRRV